MALHAAEEESLEALRKWWDDYGKQIIVAVVSAAVLWGSWTFWQNSRNATNDAASNLYEEILSLALVQPDTEIPATDRERIYDLVAELKADYSNSVYALYGAMFAAQQAVNQNDLDTAEQELQWLLANTRYGLFNRTDEGLVLTANLRLGRVMLATGDTQRALDLVQSIDPKTFEADFAELRGDIYLALDRPVDARDAYTTALQAGSTSSFLQMKLDELANDS